MQTLTKSRGRRSEIGNQRERFDTVMAALQDAADRTRRVLFHAITADDKLLVLWHCADSVREDAQNLSVPGCDQEHRALLEMNLTMSLVGTATLAMVWLEYNGVVRAANKVWAERERQRELFRDRKISFDVASPIIDVRRKFRVLAEEIGEVAHAIDQIENHGLARGNLHAELIQVAAVCVAWLESMEVTA